MDVKYVNPFISSFNNIMPQIGLADVKRGKLGVKGKVIKNSGVIVILGIIGDIRGNLIYGTSMECAKKIASTMMMGMKVDNFDEMAQSAISELTNMLTANASMEFSNEGINIEISTPTLLYGDFTATASCEPVLCVEMIVEGMPIEVNISIENS